jgi:hypothetical protein
MNPMSLKSKEACAAILLAAVLVSGCNTSGGGNSGTTTQTGNAGTTAAAKPPTTSATPNPDGTIPSASGTEKEKPAPGKGNVQGKAFYNEQPAVGVEVKLCEKFNQYFGGCSGETFTTKTDSAGEYLIKNVTPKIYEGLIVYVFNTRYYVFATSGIVQSAKYKIEPDQTYFAPDTHLFKSDLKLLNPKAGAKIPASGIEVKWDAYPDAAYYKMSIYADTNTTAKPEYDFINRRIDGLSFVLDKPLTPGAYTATVSAFNGNNVKLAESPDDIKFTVTGDAPQ